MHNEEFDHLNTSVGNIEGLYHVKSFREGHVLL